MYFLFCKDRPEGLSEAALPRAANSFAESGRTDADTSMPNSTDALQKRGFPPVFVIFVSFVNFVFYKNLCAFVSFFIL